VIAAMTLQKVADITSGVLHGENVSLVGVSTDTRSVKDGDLFVALSGENFNGNQFVEMAKQNGAIAALVTESSDILPNVLVADSRRALGLLARENRRQFAGSLVAVTGSSGKTSTKEMLANIFARCGEVFATQGNLNNEVGVPLSLLAIEERHRFAVIEMGAAKQGDINYLCEFAEPDIAILTNAQQAHIAGFGSLEVVAKTKGEIFRSLPKHGLAVINADDAYCDFWRESAKAVTQRLFSLVREDVDVFARNIDLSVPGQVQFELVSFNGSAKVCMPLSGKHMVANALAAAAASLSSGVSLDDVVAGLESMRSVSGRLLRRDIGGVAVIDDSYNANPGSVRAAIDVLASGVGRKVFVMGHMGELGPESYLRHREIAAYARENRINAVFFVGEFASLMASEFGQYSFAFSSKADLISMLNDFVEVGDTVLVKGSRSAAMEQVVDELSAKLTGGNS
jgi:UDP-N-acetylmuramoyl-tripeptide--D-alanyl-D-alanine ligase